MATFTIYVALALMANVDGTFAERPRATIKPVRGPYTMRNVTLTNPAMDSTDQRINVYYPDQGANGSFPVISYAHGYTNHPTDYLQLFSGVVSFGYVIVVPWACFSGCHDDPSSLPFDPSGFAHYYKQQLLALDWAFEAARAGTELALAKVNVSHEAGIAGHSMGGQSVVFASSLDNATDHRVGAAVMHHAYTHVYPGPAVPFLAFTGAEDLIAPAPMTEKYYSADGANPTKGLVDKLYADHFECEDPFPGQFPPNAYNPLLPQYTAAWFKLHLEHKTEEFGIDWDAMIYGEKNGTKTNSLCGGGDGKMVRCEVHR